MRPEMLTLITYRIRMHTVNRITGVKYPGHVTEG